jgi:hypothetical protein
MVLLETPEGHPRRTWIHTLFSVAQGSRAANSSQFTFVSTISESLIIILANSTQLKTLEMKGVCASFEPMLGLSCTLTTLAIDLDSWDVRAERDSITVNCAITHPQVWDGMVQF